MAEIPDLTFKLNNKPSTTKVSSEAASMANVPVVRFAAGGTTVPTVKLTPTVPIQILRVEDKSLSSNQQQLTDVHGRPMGVATPVLAQTGHANPTGGGAVNNNPGSARKKTGSSFQITSVTDGSRMSNDGGDDSADDLDESHTDDLSSELGVDMSKTDYDYSSEDAFSSIKDDPASLLHQYQHQPPLVSINTSAAAPQLSLLTTTQSGDSGDGTTTTTTTTTAVDSTPANVSVTVVESPATVPMSVVQNPEIQWHNRFRVVKIESSEPFRRGRWLCMDFLDPPPPSLSHGEVGDKDSATLSSVSGGGNGSGNSSGPNSLNHGDSLVIEHGTGSLAQTIITSTWSIDPTTQFGTTGGVSVPILSTAVTGGDKGPLISNVGVNCDHYPVSIILQTQQQGNLDFTNTALHMQGRTPQQFVPQGYNVPAAVLNSTEFTSNVPTSTTTTTSQEYQQTQLLQSGNVSDYTNALPTTSQPDLHVVSSSQALGIHQINSSTSTAPGDFVVGGGGVSPAVIAAQAQPSLVFPTPSQGANADYSQQQIVSQPINSQASTVLPSQPPQQQAPYIQQVAPVASVGGPVPVQDQIQQSEIGTAAAVNAVSATPAPTNVSTSVQQVASTTATSSASGGAGVASPSQEIADGSQQVVQPSGEEGETESSSGASTVAIDNKIEQAMDLVKSHLMFAVREEVDVLKEKITELMERINQLEFENSILKAAASPETLALLANSQTPNPPST